MDPYLEGSLWTSVHAELASTIARQLSPKLRPKYFALPVERFVLEEAEDVPAAQVYPDAGVVPRTTEVEGSGTPHGHRAPIEIATVIPARVPLVNVEIRDAANRELVTAIEILSPANKRGEGRTEYLTKRRRVLWSSVHLIEIDLLHQGIRVPMREALPLACYYVLVSREEKRPMTEVWPVAIQDPLPAIPVPLLAGDPDVVLDLQGALTTLYDALNRDLAIDYSKPHDVRLPPEEARWVAELLRSK